VSRRSFHLGIQHVGNTPTTVYWLCNGFRERNDSFLIADRKGER
jgi:hypothetical protein